MPKKNIFADIELTDEQIKAFNSELDNWKERKTKEIKESVKSELETEYSVKLKEINEEKEQFKAEQESLAEEVIKEAQKTIVARFTSAVKDIYDELKVEARKEVFSDPRIVALEEVKQVMFPLMDESVTKGYVDELQAAIKTVMEKDETIEKLKASIKIKEIIGSLSPTVAESVEAFIGEAKTEEEVVEKFAKLKSLVSESEDSDEEDEDTYDQKKKDKKKKKVAEGKKSKDDEEDDEEEDDEDFDDDLEDDDLEDEDEDEDEDDEDDEEEDDEDEEKPKRKSSRKRKSSKKKEDEEDLEEQFEINPTVKFNKVDEAKEKYNQTLNEMLVLAGLGSLEE